MEMLIGNYRPKPGATRQKRAPKHCGIHCPLRTHQVHVIFAIQELQCSVAVEDNTVPLLQKEIPS